MKNRIGIFIIWLSISAIVLPSCRAPITDRNELVSYINDEANGLKQSRHLSDLNIAMTYMPWQMFKAGSSASVTKKSEMLQLQNKLFFVLNLSAHGKEYLRQLPYDKYSEMVQVLSFRMNGFTELIPDDGKPIEPQSVLYQQTYGLSKADNILITFDQGNLLQQKEITIRIGEFGLNTGNLNFKFNINDINKIPKINF